MSLTRIGSIGINTGIAFAGVTTIVTLNTANDALSIGATVNVGSGITLGASGDIFATGVSTFSGNLKVGSGVTISPDGDGFYTGVVTATSFSGSGANLTGIDTDLVSDTSPQLGGNLDNNGKNITFGDSAGSSDDRLTFGAGTDLSIYHDDSNSRSRIEHSTDNALEILQGGNAGMLIQNQNSYNIEIKTNAEDAIKCVANGAIELYYNNNKKAETTNGGIQVTGSVACSGGSSNNLSLPDNGKVKVGTGDDLQIYHDGGNSYILNDTGNLILKDLTDAVYIQAPSIIFQDETTGENIARFISDGAVELYHNNDLKLQTHTTGFNLEGGTNNISVNLETTDSTRRGSVYANDSNMVGFLDAGGDWAIQHQNDSHTDFFIQTNKKVRIDADGLKFGTDTAAANALDDYEEGTFTPRLGGTSNSSTYYVSGYGWYRKIGRMVYTCIRMNSVDLDNNAAGDVKLHNLPFTANSPTTATDSITSDASYYNVVFNTSHQYAWYASNGGTSWVGLVSRNNTSWDSWNVSDFHASSLYINFSGWYQTDS